jgi:DNA-binding MarR family transcriptional regulator
MDKQSQTVCDALMLLIGRVKACVLTIAEDQSLTRTQLLALYSIDQHGDMTMGQMATILYCDASNITGIVDRLVAQDLVVRHEGEHDRRRKSLQLTERGRTAVEHLKAQLPSQLKCGTLTEHERDVLQSIVAKITV